jgi:hypothetical protein
MQGSITAWRLPLRAASTVAALRLRCSPTLACQFLPRMVGSSRRSRRRSIFRICSSAPRKRVAAVQDDRSLEDILQPPKFASHFGEFARERSHRFLPIMAIILSLGVR